MQNPTIGTSPKATERSWSNRFLILATAGILFLTIYPFRFNFHVLANGASPFLLGKSTKSGLTDAILNILLFVPFGFGLGEKLREGGKSARLALVTALAAGALFSYAIEFTQLYVPERDSGWEDVFTNSSGSFLGAGLYVLAGASIVGALNSIQQAVVGWLTPFRFACAVVGYFCVWFGIAGLLQRETRLSNWKPYGVIVLGNSGAGSSSRQGQIQSLQIWNHPLSAAAQAGATASGPDLTQSGAPILDYASDRDSSNVSSRAGGSSWIPGKPASGGLHPSASAEKSPLPLQTDGRDLIKALQETNHFTVHVVCTGVEVPNDLWTILLVGDGAGTLDLMAWQESGHLVFWLRSPLSAGRPQLTWFIPRVFNDHGPHDILYSYDGVNLLLYLDGKKTRTEYIVGPGASLARLIHRLKPSELAIYNYAFYALVFAVAGGLLGLFEPRGDSRSKLRMVVLEVAAIVIGALILELILVGVTGRTISRANLALSMVLGLAGLLWAHADGERLLPGAAR
ncbi:MAG TPA: VanZ family protein [Candidatus Acidoferrales bacterium]